MEKSSAFHRYVKYLFLISAGLLVMSALLYWFGIRGIMKKTEEVEVAVKQEENDLLIKRIALQHVHQELTEEELLELIRKVPQRPEIEELVIQLEDWKKKSDLSLENITFSLIEDGRDVLPKRDQEVGQRTGEINETALEKLGEVQKEGEEPLWSCVEMAVVFSGTREALDHFMHEAKKTNRLIHIYHLEYALAEEKEDLLEGTLVLHAYYTEELNQEKDRSS